MAELQDAELVARTKSGDRDAFKELVSRYQGHVYGLAYSLVGDWTEAQDIAQETFIRAYSNLDQLQEPASFAAWLRRVTFSVAMNWLRAFRPGLYKELDGRVELESLEVPDFAPGPPEVVEKRQLAEAVMNAVDSLPQKYRVPLTMFHLDGLSYQKVASFLDIPLGTVKSLISRARSKLKAALPAAIGADLAPVVQEVFNEHKLPKEFAMKVLEGITELSYHKWDCTFCGSLFACMEYLKEPVTYDFVMGVSGSAFKLVWNRKWCPSNNSLGIFGEEPIRRAFRALGYNYEHLSRHEREVPAEELRSAVIASIEKKRPVIAHNVDAFPEAGVVAGYDEDGDALLGRSFILGGKGDYYRKSDWQENIWDTITIGDKVGGPSRRTILKESLEWAIKLARTPDMLPDRACGLAAYDFWANELLNDGNFPKDNMKTLTFRCTVSNGVTLCGLCDARRAAALFLNSMADAERAANTHVLKAAEAYDALVGLLRPIAKEAPLCWHPEPERLKMADPAFRRRFADALLKAKEKDEAAVRHLEAALAALGD
ncbi:MAG: sigma-70 family RNA polymerase sigma factor [Candidatus Coatesbacteria bacterium]|nr:sigma-70 family RNA polymerase sigma factor [Candidatus Coatesbacteria bacterium]